MKNTKKIICLVVLVTMLLLLLSGCGSANDWQTMRQLALKMEETVDDLQVRQNTEQMLGYILADDFENAYTMVCAVATKEAFRQPYAEIRAVLEGVTDYELVASNKSVNVTNGVTSVRIRYMLTSGEKKILVESTCTGGYMGLAGFYVYTYIPVTQTGTLTTMRGANVFQWVILVIGLVEIGFMIWMFVDCCRHKIRRKWLWLLLILLGAIAASVTVENGINFRYNIGLFFNLYTTLIRYSTGGFTLRLMIPVGAVVYAVLKKNLIRPVTEEQPVTAEHPQLPEQPVMQKIEE